MYKPEFPYKGNQVIISSGRVTNHSYDDFIFMFGKKGVSISSPATFTVDATESTSISSGFIELGLRAKLEGEPILLGRKTAFQLGQLLDNLQALGNSLANISESGLAASLPQIIASAKILADTAPVIKKQLQGPCLSKTTYTK
jgi:hypothetical protein